MSFKTALSISVFTFSALLLASCQPQTSGDTASLQAMKAGFENPPNEARPRVWWHWLGGNVTKEGIDKDLAWMNKVGIGGVQNFDASLGTPKIIDELVGFNSPKWRTLKKHAVSTANDYGMEFAIAGSPGWSETGGPWVAPKDGMKKLVWSDVIIPVGGAFSGPLPKASDGIGTFAGLAHHDPLKEGGLIPKGSHQAEQKAKTYYQDISVLAYPIAGLDYVPSVVSLPIGKIENTDRISDGDYNIYSTIEVPKNGQAPIVNFTYDKIVTARSAQLFVPNARPPFSEAKYQPILEANIGGKWQSIAPMPLYEVPTTIGFAPIRAKQFRLRFIDNPVTAPGLDEPVEGAIKVNIFAGASATHFNIGEFSLSPNAKVNQAEVRAGFAIIPNYSDLPPISFGDTQAINLDDIIDLTGKVDAKGELNWSAPDDRAWRIVRYGASLTGKENHPAAPDATGLEVDKFDGKAVRRYLDHYLSLFENAVGAELVGTNGLNAFLTDSIEVAASNWTAEMPEKFEAINGYSVLKYLPVLSGEIVDSPEASEAFLYDWRQTLETLLTQEHYKTIADFATEKGLTVYGEALENSRPVLGDDLAMRKYADVPMAALWSFKRDGQARSTLVGDMLGAASVANIYGKEAVSAESMTSAFAPWAFAPENMKRLADFELVHGINRLIIHTSVHQPSDDIVPGLSLAIFGQYFNRHAGWANMARPFVDYIARSSYLLQQGQSVRDIAVFAGDDMPITVLYLNGEPQGLPQGFGFDFVNAEMIETDFKIKQNKFTAPSGVDYSVLQILDGARMQLSTLKQLEQWANSGVKIVGPAPSYAPSLRSDKIEFDALVTKLWSGGSKNITDQEINQAMSDFGLVKDFVVDDAVKILHRRSKTADIYFLTNQSQEQKNFTANFRVDGKTPSLWNAVTGKTEAASFSRGDGVTKIPMNLRPEQSMFVVFSGHEKETDFQVGLEDFKTVKTLNQKWNLSFQKGRGAPDNIQLNSLSSLSENANSGVKYFSGEVLYEIKFNTDIDGIKTILDLGDIGDVAEIIVNEQSAGIVWTKPYQVEITDFLREGSNNLKIKISNRWANRLIGDAQKNAVKIGKVFAPTYVPTASLHPSGLLGPVTILKSINP